MLEAVVVMLKMVTMLLLRKEGRKRRKGCGYPIRGDGGWNRSSSVASRSVA